MEKCGTTSQVAEDEEWFVKRLVFVGREEDVIEPEAEPVYQGARDPDHIEQ